jgi:hypothetical protein
MFSENYKLKSASHIDTFIQCDSKHKERMSTKTIIGEYFDQDLTTGKVIHNWKKNLIVLDFGRLLAALCKEHSGIGGIKYWEVGSGDPVWDTSPVEPQVGDTELLAPHTRVPVTIFFLDSSNDRITDPAVITNKIEMEAMFGEGVATGALREFGVFGGDATSAVGSGIMCDRVIHPVINKPENMALLRKLRFTF